MENHVQDLSQGRATATETLVDHITNVFHAINFHVSRIPGEKMRTIHCVIVARVVGASCQAARRAGGSFMYARLGHASFSNSIKGRMALIGLSGRTWPRRSLNSVLFDSQPGQHTAIWECQLCVQAVSGGVAEMCV